MDDLLDRYCEAIRTATHTIEAEVVLPMDRAATYLALQGGLTGLLSDGEARAPPVALIEELAVLARAAVAAERELQDRLRR